MSDFCVSPPRIDSQHSVKPSIAVPRLVVGHLSGENSQTAATEQQQLDWSVGAADWNGFSKCNGDLCRSLGSRHRRSTGTYRS